MKLKEVPKVDRPREKLEKYGVGKLSNSELLAILLRTGGKGKNVMEVAEGLLKKFSGVGLSEATVEELMKTFALGRAKGSEIVACFELGRRLLKDKKHALLLSPQDVWKELKDLRDHKKEHFVIFYLNARNQEIKRDIISVGTLTANLVHPREVFEPAVTHLAAHIVVAHNHPSGDVSPSKEDITTTRQLVAAGHLLGIPLRDHIIVTKKEYYSFRDNYQLHKET